MRDSSYSNEAVLFFEKDQVTKEMTYSEFEAILDGVVGLNDFAGEMLKAAFVIVNGRLKVTGIALFTIAFDRQGFADRAWNLPLRHLVDTGGSGPDLGAGPVKLSCKSQCSVSWHTGMMWDPDLSPKTNTFSRIRDAIAANRLHLQSIAEADVVAPAQQMQPPPNWGVAPAARAPASPWAGGGQEPPTLQPGWVDDSGLTESQLAVLESEHRKKIAALIKQQRLHIQTLTSESQQTLASTRLNYEKELQIAKIEIARLRSEHESLHSQNIALREQNESQRKQLDTLKKSHEIEAQAVQRTEQQVEALRKEYSDLMEQKIQEATAKLKEDIELRNMELMYRHEVAKQLREELCQLRKDKIRLVNEGGDKFLERLENLGISFIAFHPGAGHISVPLADMSEYMENPIAYAANKCLVSEEHYRFWLAHYQKPECQAPLTNDKVCGCRIRRTDVPSQFLMGESDRCDKHKPRTFGDNVVNLRG